MTAKSHDSEVVAEARDSEAKETTTMMQQETGLEDTEKGEASNLFVRLKSASEGFKHVLLQVGSCGKWQIKVFLMTSFSGIWVAFHNLSAGKEKATHARMYCIC